MSEFMEGLWRNRTYCDCLQEIRECAKTLNFGAVIGLLEELQAYGSRMEAGLGDQRDLIKLNEKRHLAKNELKKLEAQIEKKKAELKALRLKKK